MDHVNERLSLYAANVQHSARTSLERLTPEQWLRLLVIGCGYALLRPYLLRLGGRHQAADHERALDPAEANDLQQASGKVVRDPRTGEIRERIDVPEDTDSGSDGAGATGADWGKKARRRQRRVVRTLLEREEKRREMEAREESDKEIEDLLVD